MKLFFIKTVITGLVLIMGLSGISHAHPHVFVNAQVGFVVDKNQRLQSLHISWQYDAFTTLFLFDALNLDNDADGQLTDADLATVAAAETDWPPDYNGDVHLTVAGEAWDLSRPQNATAEMVNNEIIVSFDLPLTKPTAMSGRHASLRLYDPAYYYAYTMAIDPDNQVLDARCQATTIEFEPDQAATETLWVLSKLSREETPSDPDIGARFADEIVLKCD